MCVACVRWSRHRQAKTLNPGDYATPINATPVVQIDATRHEQPENEIYAMNQKVGNQNSMI